MAGTDGHMEDSSRIRDHRRLLVWPGLFFLVLQSSFEGFLRLPLQALVTKKAWAPPHTPPGPCQVEFAPV